MVKRFNVVCSINWKKAEIITFDEEVLHFKLVTLSMVARHRLGWGYWHELGGNKYAFKTSNQTSGHKTETT